MENNKLINAPFSVVSECLWSQSLKIWTIVISIILIVALIQLFRYIYLGNGTTAHIICVVLLIFAFASSVFLSPKYVAIQNDEVQIKMIGMTKHISLEAIDHIEKFSNRKGLCRTCGIGSFYGNIGYFTSSLLGNFIAFVTDWSKSYVIYRKDKKPIVVSVEDPSIFDKFMQKDPS